MNKYGGIGRMVRQQGPTLAPGAPKPPAWMKPAGEAPPMGGAMPWMQGGSAPAQMPWMAGAPAQPSAPSVSLPTPPGGVQSDFAQGMPGSVGNAPQEQAERLRRLLGQGI